MEKVKSLKEKIIKKNITSNTGGPSGVSSSTIKPQGAGGQTSGASQAGRKKPARLPFPLPQLGQPGGKDDPLRHGLSGAGVRKYLRLLHQGSAPEDARKQVLQEKEERAKNPPLQQKGNGKRGAEHITPPPQPKSKRSKPAVVTTGQVTSYASAAKTFRMAILPKAYPEVMLDATQLSSLEEALVEEMVESSESGLQYTGIHFRSGLMLVDCKTAQTAEWLARTAPQLKTWKGPELDARKGDDIPKPHTISIFFPRSKEMPVEKILKLVKVQNPELPTPGWKVINSKPEGHGQVLTIGIDPKSCEIMKAGGCAINYRFGQIPVSGLKKGQQKPKPEAMEVETPTTSQRTEKDQEEVEGMHLDLLEVHDESSGTSQKTSGEAITGKDEGDSKQD